MNVLLLFELDTIWMSDVYIITLITLIVFVAIQVPYRTDEEIRFPLEKIYSKHA